MMTHQVRYKCYFLLHLLDNVVARQFISIWRRDLGNLDRRGRDLGSLQQGTDITSSFAARILGEDCFSEFDGWIVNWRKRFWLYHSSKRGSANDPGGFVFRGGEDGTAQAYLGRAMVLF
ncbi:hypothetical protein CUMW_156070 [Citrus unshiu]|uniref:Uncharacterized protein n=1 Tax=Citrus unshiu TaxID=55188 RepID=A0A2H5PPQ6_CITUN|nr:hypothetical protein CUMW_156070 [Citrus unshiu]